MIDLSHATLLAADAMPYYIGDDWSIIFAFTASGSPIDVAGYTFHATIRDTTGAILLARVSTDSAEIELLSPTTLGKIRVRIARTESVAEGSRHRIDIVRVDGSSGEQTWAFGLFESQARITPTPLP